MKVIDGVFKFTVSEVAQFFGKSTQWVHYGEREKFWEFDVERSGDGRTRLYTPDQIELMAVSLIKRSKPLLDEAGLDRILESLERYR